MEKAIDDLKQLYRNAVPPMTKEEGLMDLFERIDNVKKVPFYFSRVFLTLSIIMVIISGFSGMTLAASPMSPLYPVKKATLQVVSDFSQPNVDLKTKIGNVLTPKKAQPTPTSTLTPTPKVKDAEKEDNNENNNSKNDEKTNQSKSEVKGINTVSPAVIQQQTNENANKNEQNENKPSRENRSPGRSDNSQGNSSTNVSETQQNQGKGNNK